MKIVIDTKTKWVQVNEATSLGHLIDVLKEVSGEKWKDIRVPTGTILHYSLRDVLPEEFLTKKERDGDY